MIKRTINGRSANEKTVGERLVARDTGNKNCNLIHLQFNHQKLKVCSKIHVQSVRCLIVSVVLCIVELNGIGFQNALNIFSIA